MTIVGRLGRHTAHTSSHFVSLYISHLTILRSIDWCSTIYVILKWNFIDSIWHVCNAPRIAQSMVRVTSYVFNFIEVNITFFNLHSFNCKIGATSGDHNNSFSFVAAFAISFSHQTQFTGNSVEYTENWFVSVLCVYVRVCLCVSAGTRKCTVSSVNEIRINRRPIRFPSTEKIFIYFCYVSLGLVTSIPRFPPTTILVRRRLTFVDENLFITGDRPNIVNWIIKRRRGRRRWPR